MGLGDPLYPGLGNGGYDVLHYTIDLDVDVESNFINGEARIEAKATQGAFVLQSGSARSGSYRGARVRVGPRLTPAMETS